MRTFKLVFILLLFPESIGTKFLYLCLSPIVFTKRNLVARKGESMKAITWQGKHKVQVDNVPDPTLEQPRDAIIEITSSAICGSDVHLYNGFVPTMEHGDILGHEFAGRVVAVGADVTRVKVGDRVVIPFTISCGKCFYCVQEMFSLCSETNPNAHQQEALIGYGTAGLYGYSHMYGGFPGGQAQYVRVPHVDVGACVLPEGISEEHALFLSDIFPTGYMAAENCDIKAGQTIAVWGCGPVGQFAIRSAFMLGAERVVAIDEHESRLELAASAGAHTINFSEVNVFDSLKSLTNGRGPDACIEAVGFESNGHTVDAVMDGAMQVMHLQTDRSHALREAIKCCRPGGTISIPGVYLGTLNAFPLGVIFAKGVNLKMGQTHVQKYMQPLLQKIINNEIDPREIVSHRITLDEVPDAYSMFAKRDNMCTKVVITPNAESATRAA